MRRILVTGGAGFIGSAVAVRLRESTDAGVVVVDNLRRRGSERHLARLQAAGVEFVHGDVRQRSDLEAVGAFDLLVECSAEPSVLSHEGGQRDYVLATNLEGALHCAELCLRHGAPMIFLSTSRVYPLAPLRSLRLHEAGERFELARQQDVAGVTVEGVGEDFPLAGPRSFYGASKYAAEVLLAEYAEAFSLPVVVDRCGVVAGPGQFGKVDQGIVTWWLRAHLEGRPLAYLGFGGSGRQVRDILHVDDLVDLVVLQAEEPQRFAGRPYNVGGGRERSVSLRELTHLCREVTGCSVPVAGDPEERYADVPWFVTDAGRIRRDSGWHPRRSLHDVVADTAQWLRRQPSAAP